VFVRNASEEPIYHAVITQEPDHYPSPSTWSVIGPQQEVHDQWSPRVEDLGPGVLPQPCCRSSTPLDLRGSGTDAGA
jgi:hypothetical protein